MKKLTIISTLILFVFGNLFAQTGQIKGFVKDKETGELLVGVTIHVEVAGNLTGDASNPFGKYTINPVKTGIYTVYASSVGYKKSKIYDVEVTSDNITYVNIDMESAATEIDEFAIVEVYHEVPLIKIDEPHVKTLLAKDLKNDPNIHTPKALLNRIPGVTASENGNVYVRGSRPQSTQFIISS
jgi:hypothetical protein